MRTWRQCSLFLTASDDSKKRYFCYQENKKQLEVCYQKHEILYHGGKEKMLDEQKQLIQAQHRLEQAQMRNRSKEQKARTRRLIQEGAILEKVFPWVKNIEDLNDLEERLCYIVRKTE